MGQYYYPMSIDRKKFIVSHDVGDVGGDFVGLKLMEHSYLGNSMMNVVENLLMPGKAWHKTRIVWSGDYADEEPNTVELPDYPNGKTLHTIIGENDRNRIKKLTLRRLVTPIPEEYKYIVNHSLMQFVDKSKIKKCPDWEGRIHPLSLLTAEGNGRGGGDFHGDDVRIGMWARHKISIEKEIDESQYQEIDGQFVEER